MQNLPAYIYVTFYATVTIALWLFFKASNYSRPFMVFVVVWIIFQSVLAISGFYSDPDRMHIRVPVLVLPTILFILLAFVSKKGRAFIDGLDLPTLTMFHVIRLPVEVVLSWLFLNNTIPEAMTFHGRNFDIFSGISAPLIYYFGFVKKKISRQVIIAWNLVCLVLLLNVVTNAILSLPARFQQYGFEQPNIAVGFFPFVLLPACLVPLVLFSTLA